MMRAPEVCIYHDLCAHGFTAAWAVEAPLGWEGGDLLTVTHTRRP